MATRDSQMTKWSISPHARHHLTTPTRARVDGESIEIDVSSSRHASCALSSQSASCIQINSWTRGFTTTGIDTQRKM